MQDVTPESPGQRQMLVVAGSGRIGTSLFTGLTGRLGVHIPKPEERKPRRIEIGGSDTKTIEG